jgi:LexA-binding, inner membrane-associated putative hydrolase
MFLGHFALALSAKKAAPKASLGTLVLSAQFADCLWPVLLLLGVEQVRIVPGLMRASPFDFVSYPISHSLLMQLVWGLLFGVVYLLWRRDLRTALVVGALLPTHWLLDYFAHRPDMPLYPGGGPKLGLGMWNSVPLTLLVEYGMLVAGVAIYLGATRSKGGRNIAFWSLIIFLALVYPASLFGPPPPSVRALAVSALAIWLTIPWAAAADRHREPVP